LDGRIAEYCGAVMDDAQSGFLNYTSVFIIFFIDKEGKVIDYTVKEERAE
jgi:hypothetical protein